MIKLTHPERRLRDLLVSAANTWPRKPDQPESLTIRFAGGWVRDKLLSLPNDDIDVAVNIATGVQFATHIETYLRQLPNSESFHFNTINRNVEQSKHLETATAHFMSLDLDFVNLRSEEYAEDSRIPETMGFGTPLQDAERRDLTINSLFYNLHTERVEDWTEKGIEDIKNGVIRTPLDPITTFKDDPLRVLRAARFAARLDFKITPEVKAAMMDTTVKERLRNHVTIPRKADEIKKLLKGPNHLKALELIDECNLYNHIFTLSKREPGNDPASNKNKTPRIDPIINPPHPPTESVVAGHLVNYLLQHRIAEFLQLDKVDSTLVWLMAGLAPWRGYRHPNPPKKEPKFCSSLITKHELMYGEIRGVVEDVFEYNKMTLVKDAVEGNAVQDILREDAVMWIRQLGQNWRVITYTALLYDLIPFSSPVGNPEFHKIMTMYTGLVETIYSHGVENADAAKRLIPGNELAKLLGGLPPRQITEAQEKAIIFQIVENISTQKEMEVAIAAGRFKFP